MCLIFQPRGLKNQKKSFNSNKLAITMNNYGINKFMSVNITVLGFYFFFLDTP